MTIAFNLIDKPGEAVLAWTTTPWTLPSNLALCVHPDFTYLKIHDEATDRIFYIHEALLGTLYPKIKTAKYKKLGTVTGKEMKGWKYEPLFPYFADKVSQIQTLDESTIRRELTLTLVPRPSILHPQRHIRHIRQRYRYRTSSTSLW